MCIFHSEQLIKLKNALVSLKKQLTTEFASPKWILDCSSTIASMDDEEWD